MTDIAEELRAQLPDSLEVVHQVDALIIKRAHDGRFVARFEPNEMQLVLSAHAVLGDPRQSGVDDALMEAGQAKVADQIERLSDAGFRRLGKGRLLRTNDEQPGIYERHVPRYLQPMCRQVEDLGQAAKLCTWLEDQDLHTEVGPGSEESVREAASGE